MLEFTCKTCGKRIQGDETLAGMRVLCPACSAAMTFPQLASAGQSATSAAGQTGICERPAPLAEPMPMPAKEIVPHVARRWTPWLIVSIVVVIGVGLAIPQIRKMRESALRTESANNLKQIGLAFHSFHDANRRLPYNGTEHPYRLGRMKVGGPAIGGDGSTGSWAFMILPYLDHQALFNAKDPGIGVAAFMCPGRGRPIVASGDPAGAWTDYFLNSFLNDPNGRPNVPDRRRKLAEFPDGTSWTIMVGHGQIMPADYAATEPIAGYTDVIFNGGSAGTCRPNRAVSCRRDAEDSPPGDWGGPFPQGWLVTMCDGRVLAFPHALTGGTITNGVCDIKGGSSVGGYLTPDGGEAVTMWED